MSLRFASSKRLDSRLWNHGTSFINITERERLSWSRQAGTRLVFGFVFGTWNWCDFWRRSWGLPCTCCGRWDLISRNGTVSFDYVWLNVINLAYTFCCVHFLAVGAGSACEKNFLFFKGINFNTVCNQNRLPLWELFLSKGYTFPDPKDH